VPLALTVGLFYAAHLTVIFYVWLVVRQLFDPSVYHAPHPDTRRRLQGVDHRTARLTRREHEILSLVVEGRTNGEIARERIQRSLEAYEGVFAHYAGWDWPTVSEHARRFDSRVFDDALTTAVVEAVTAP